MIPNVIDIHHGAYDGALPPFAELKNQGVLGVILKASEGGTFTPDHGPRPATPALVAIAEIKNKDGKIIRPGRAASEAVPAQPASATGKYTFQDPHYVDRAGAADEIGLLVGAYHFLNNRPADVQAANFLNAVAIKAPDDMQNLLLAVDYEKDETGHGRTPALHTLVEFITRVEAVAGRKMVIYGSDLIGETIKPHAGGHQSPAMADFDYFLRQRRLWLAAYGRGAQNPPSAPWPWNIAVIPAGENSGTAPGVWLWQYQASKDNTGDFNFFPRDAEALAKEWSGNP